MLLCGRDDHTADSCTVVGIGHLISRDRSGCRSGISRDIPLTACCGSFAFFFPSWRATALENSIATPRTVGSKDRSSNPLGAESGTFCFEVVGQVRTIIKRWVGYLVK
jgi:hypothetical protein